MAYGMLCFSMAVPVDAALDRKLTRTDLCVLGILHSFWAANMTAYPSIGGLAKRCATSESAIHRSVARLRKAGWVRVQFQSGTRSTFHHGRMFVRGGRGVRSDTPGVGDTQVDHYQGPRLADPERPWYGDETAGKHKRVRATRRRRDTSLKTPLSDHLTCTGEQPVA